MIDYDDYRASPRYLADLKASDADPEPCQCHRSVAYVSPIHAGHCCFFPADQTCHPDEAAAWKARRVR